ncbi:MAG TPA: class I SAM-dependent methyltransferase [Kofleriaceae bacterium]
MLVRRPAFIARQAGFPTGLLGRLLLGVMARETARFNAEILDVLATNSGEHVLELGHGHGRTLAGAAARAPGARFSAIDVAPAATKVTARRCRDLIAAGRLDLRTGDGASLPWATATFDATFTVHTIYFWPAPAQQLHELRRVLRPGARLVLGFRERSVEAVAQFPEPTYRFYSTDEIGALLADADMSNIGIRMSGTGHGLRIAVARAGR